MRDLLNSLPDWVLVPSVIGVTVIITLLALWLIKRFLPDWRQTPAGGTVVGVAAMVMTLFALILAFLIVNLYNGYESANANVGSEANSLDELLQSVRSFSNGEQQSVDLSVAKYVREVRGPEFEDLEDGSPDPRADALLYAIYGTVRQYIPKNAAQANFYRSATDELNAVVAERHNRVGEAENAIPGPLLALMLLLAVMTLLITVFLKATGTGIDLVLIVSVAVVVGAGLVTAAVLEYPFSGSIAVSSGPFDQGSVAQVAGK